MKKLTKKGYYQAMRAPMTFGQGTYYFLLLAAILSAPISPISGAICMVIALTILFTGGITHE